MRPTAFQTNTSVSLFRFEQVAKRNFRAPNAVSPSGYLSFMLEVKPFTISVSDDEINDLQRRLRSIRWPDQLESAGWEQGTELAFLQELASYWEAKYDWRKAEAYLRSTFHSFVLSGAAGVERVHFIHERSPRADARPLLLLHGWPGSFYEFHKVVPKLTNPAPDKPAFHVVVPSLPGFGFSAAPTTKGFGLRAMARTFNSLMHRLGYSKYFSQGGDWGSLITKALGMDFPESCRAIHINSNFSTPTWYNPLHWLQYANAAFLPELPLFLSGEELKAQRRVQDFLKTGNGYYIIQATKPQSLGYAMTDSPVGLLAWIVEKFYDWSDNGGNIENSFTKDEILTNVSLYWFTRRATSSFRTYYEANATGDFKSLLGGYCAVPTGISVFAVDINAPEGWARPRYNLKRYRSFSNGGHFAALETPEILTHEIQDFFATCFL